MTVGLDVSILVGYVAGGVVHKADQLHTTMAAGNVVGLAVGAMMGHAVGVAVGAAIGVAVGLADVLA